MTNDEVSNIKHMVRLLQEYLSQEKADIKTPIFEELTGLMFPDWSTRVYQVLTTIAWTLLRFDQFASERSSDTVAAYNWSRQDTKLRRREASKQYYVEVMNGLLKPGAAMSLDKIEQGWVVYQIIIEAQMRREFSL